MHSKVALHPRQQIVFKICTKLSNPSAVFWNINQISGNGVGMVFRVGRISDDREFRWGKISWIPCSMKILRVLLFADFAD